MDKTGLEKVKIDEVISKIRLEVRSELLAEHFCFIPKENYTLKELLQYHGAEFIHAAYTAVLRRSPDSEGGKQYLSNLENGALSKVDIVGRLRFSPEGRRTKTQIKGLRLPFLLHCSYKIPAFGRVLRVLTAVISLPRLVFHINSLDVKSERVSRQLRALQQSGTATTQKANHLSTTVTQIGQAIDQLQGQLQQSDQRTASSLSEYKTALNGIHLSLGKILKSFNSEPQANFSLPQTLNIKAEEEHLFDATYIVFEERFRGAREEIKNRLQVYIPYAKMALQSTNDSPMLDVGCGRGEWLEIATEHNIKIKGIDLNRLAVAQCTKLGFDVEEFDVIEYLQNVDDNSLSLVTGFHIVEHLPFNTLILLLRESLRVLKPGGIAIFETPNPENIFVATHLFYTDPTHRNPIVPETISFLTEQQGFSRAEIIRLHKYSDFYPMSTNDKFLKAHFCNEMDFAVIGYKE